MAVGIPRYTVGIPRCTMVYHGIRIPSHCPFLTRERTHNPPYLWACGHWALTVSITLEPPHAAKIVPRIAVPVVGCPLQWPILTWHRHLGSPAGLAPREKKGTGKSKKVSRTPPEKDSQSGGFGCVASTFQNESQCTPAADAPEPRVGPLRAAAVGGRGLGKRAPPSWRQSEVRLQT